MARQPRDLGEPVGQAAAAAEDRGLPRPDNLAELAAAGALPGDRLGSYDKIAASLLLSLPALFHQWGYLVNGYRIRLSVRDIQALFVVFSVALVLVALLRGLTAVRQLVSLSAAVAVTWMAIFTFIYDPAYSTQAALSYVAIFAFALVLHGHLLPLYALSHLDHRSRQLRAALAGPAAAPASRIDQALAGSRRLGWLLSALVGIWDIWFLVMVLKKGPNQMWQASNLGLGLAPLGAALVVGLILLVRLGRHELDLRRSGPLSEALGARGLRGLP